MGFKLVVETAKVLKFLENVQKQADYAMMRTLNQAAFDARAAVIANLPKWLTIRKPGFLPRAVAVNKATKQNLVAEVGFMAKVKFGTLLEEGGVRRPKSASKLAIPEGVRTSPNQIVPKRLSPSALKGRKDVFRATLNGTDGIWQRIGKDRLKLLYVLDQKTEYEPHKIHFRQTVKIVALRTIGNNLSKNVEAAMRSAKR